LALAWGPLVSLSTIATGNHYVFDLAAGLAVTVLGGAIAFAVTADRLHTRGHRSGGAQLQTAAH
jgi:membrane-associated phospholipid phosphatase